jgi:HlyD family secretion protein
MKLYASLLLKTPCQILLVSLAPVARNLRTRFALALRDTARPMPAAQFLPADEGLRMRVTIGLMTVALLVVGVGGWMAMAQISGAVVAGGLIVVDSNVKKVQHLAGGIAGEIRVRDGDTVNAGDLVLRLDETITRANLQVITKQIDELAVRQARLKAERDGSETMQIPRALIGRQDEREVDEMLAGERTLFESRRIGRAGQKAQLRERIAQLNEEIAGLTAQQQAKATELELVKTELASQHQLWAKNLIAITKYTAMQREAARLAGERAHLIAAAAQAKGKIAETELQVIQLDQDLRTEVIKDMRDIQAKEAELYERRVAAEDQLKRIDIRAPQAGIVHQLAVHTVGGVVMAGEPIMLIVPGGDALVIEAKVAPQDIDQVKLSQPAVVRFPAFNQRTTPEFNGVVSRISADISREPQTNQAYYVVRITLPDKEMERLGQLKVIPGMPAEVHIRTTDRTALSYLVKPVTDQFARAFKER